MENTESEYIRQKTKLSRDAAEGRISQRQYADLWDDLEDKAEAGAFGPEVAEKLKSVVQRQGGVNPSDLPTAITKPPSLGQIPRGFSHIPQASAQDLSAAGRQELWQREKPDWDKWHRERGEPTTPELVAQEKEKARARGEPEDSWSWKTPAYQRELAKQSGWRKALGQLGSFFKRRV